MRRGLFHLRCIGSLTIMVSLAAVVATGQTPQPTEREIRDRDPYLNGQHALRDKNNDPGEGWDLNDPRIRGLGVAVTQLSADWPWGELHFGKSYPVTLDLINNCKGAQQASLFVTDLPYLNIQRTVNIPAESTIVLRGTITTPAPPQITGPAAVAMPHGYFIQIEGRVVVWHAFEPNEPCMPSREVYNADGHVHFGDPADGKPSPEKIAGATPCQVWWNTGEKPPKATEETCTHDIQVLAEAYRARALQPLAERDPARWKWLPSLDEISRQSIQQLLAMKTRAQAIIQTP